MLKDDRVPFGEVADGALRMNAVVVEVECELAKELPDVRWRDAVVGVAYSDAVEETDVEEIWAVPLICNRKAGYVEGLLITRASRRKDGWFRRVGYFNSAEESTAAVDWLELFPMREICIA